MSMLNIIKDIKLKNPNRTFDWKHVHSHPNLTMQIVNEYQKNP